MEVFGVFLSVKQGPQKGL